MRLVAHKVFTPTPGDPIDFEATIEKTLREWHARFRVRQVLFDPFQMAAVAQRLARERMPIEEYPQTVPNLTAATSNLFDLISARQIGAVSRRRDAAGDLARDHRRERARLAARQAQAAAQDRRDRCVEDGGLAAVRDGGKPRYDTSIFGSMATTSRWICTGRSNWRSTGTS